MSGQSRCRKGCEVRKGTHGTGHGHDDHGVTAVHLGHGMLSAEGLVFFGAQAKEWSGRLLSLLYPQKLEAYSHRCASDERKEKEGERKPRFGP